MNEHISRLLVRIGQGWNKVYVAVPYMGAVKICPELLEAIDKALVAKYGEQRWRYFDFIEILGEI